MRGYQKKLIIIVFFVLVKGLIFAQIGLDVKNLGPLFQKSQKAFKFEELNKKSGSNDNWKLLDELKNNAIDLKQNLEFYKNLLDNKEVPQIVELKFLIDSLNFQIKSFDKIKLKLDLNKEKPIEELINILSKAKELEVEYEEIKQRFIESIKGSKLKSGAVPQIDGLQSRISPSVVVKGNYNVGGKISFLGEVFTGNTLNSNENISAIYNPNSSSYGVIFSVVADMKLGKSDFYIAPSFYSSYAGKSIYRIDTTALDFEQFHTKLSFEVGYKNAFAFYVGRNFINPMDQISKLNELFSEKLIPAMPNVVSTNTNTNQEFYNIGFKGVYTFDKITGLNFGLDLNGIILEDKQEKILEKPGDHLLVIIKLSLTKSL